MKQILVIGDIMLDVYVNVAVDRISPEAPVPVMREKSRHRRPGGAANVAENIIALGCAVELIGVVGINSPIIGNFIVQDHSRVTTTKTRFVAPNGQQIARLDEENTHPLNDETESFVKSRILDVFQREDISALVISDYAKGVCTDSVIRSSIVTAQCLEIPVIVDPKRQNWDVYEGATVITPNEKEYTERRGDVRFPHTLVTLGDRGMELIGVASFKTSAVNVYDVTGAGDTVVAALAVGLAKKVPLIDCCRFANVAAGIVVGKRGTATVTMEEMRMIAMAMTEQEKE